MTLLDDFQGGLDPGWSVVTQTFEHEPYVGAAGVDNESAHLYGNSAEAVYNVGAPIETFSFYYRERSESKGMAITLESSGGQPVVAAGTSNPQWRVNGTQIANPDTYKTWMQVELEIDPQASEVTATFTDQSYSGGSQTVTKPLLTSTYPTTIRVHASFKGDTSVGSYTDSWVDEIAYTSPVTTPSAVSTTVDADDTLSVSWTNDVSQGEHRVELQRDGGSWVDPAGGPSLVTVGSSSADYGPASDTEYDRQVGLDSSFRVRVRHEVGPSRSDWTYSETVYSQPLPPRNPHAERPNANTITIQWENASDTMTKTAVFYRRDTGNGYGAWQFTGEVNNTTTAKGQTASLSFNIETHSWLVANARYQFRLRHETEHDGGREDSEWLFHDYGNLDGVVFSDDFATGDLSEWDESINGGTVTSGGHTDTGVSGPVSGSQYYLGFGNGGDNGTYLQKNLGDLSDTSDLHVRVRFAVGSLDTPAEDFGVEWYDGSTWQELSYLHWENNKQGWVDIHETVPQEWLSADNRLRVGTTTASGSMYGGDYFAVDEVVVADHVHEHTTPAPPTDLTASMGENRHELAVSWTDSLVDYPGAFYEIRTRVSDSNEFEKIPRPPETAEDVVKPGEGFSHSVPRRDGEQYEVRVDALMRQDRHGDVESYPRRTSEVKTATTRLPSPTALSVDDVGTNSAELSWTTNNDYGGVRVDRRPADASSWTTAASGLDLSTESHTLTGLRDGEQYDARVVATTEHSETEDV